MASVECFPHSYLVIVASQTNDLLSLYDQRVVNEAKVASEVRASLQMARWRSPIEMYTDHCVDRIHRIVSLVGNVCSRASQPVQRAMIVSKLSSTLSCR